MPRSKPITPYERLLREFNRFQSKVKFPKKRNMWTYEKDKLGRGWELNTLYQRVAAAETLGYDVQLYATEHGLEVKYVQKRPV